MITGRLHSVEVTYEAMKDHIIFVIFLGYLSPVSSPAKPANDDPSIKTAATCDATGSVRPLHVESLVRRLVQGSRLVLDRHVATAHALVLPADVVADLLVLRLPSTEEQKSQQVILI